MWEHFMCWFKYGHNYELISEIPFAQNGGEYYVSKYKCKLCNKIKYV